MLKELYMHTAILSAESESDFRMILELSEKLNFKTKVLEDIDGEQDLFVFANDTSLNEWLTKEEDEAWKNL